MRFSRIGNILGGLWSLEIFSTVMVYFICLVYTRWLVELMGAVELGGGGGARGWDFQRLDFFF